MTKVEFLEHLNKKLQILNEKERDDILSEYAQHIEFKMEQGLCEEEAIRDFGNLEELEAELLAAYNVNPDYGKTISRIDKSKIRSHVARIGNHVRKHRLFTISVIIGALVLVYIPFVWMALSLAEYLYIHLGGPLDILTSWGILLGFHIVYLVASVRVLVALISRRRQSQTAEENQDDSEMKEIIETKEKKARFLWQLPSLPSILHITRTERRVDRTSINIGYFMTRIWGVMKRCMVLLMKGAGICVLTPVLLGLFCLVMLFGLLLVLLVLGYPVIGLSIMLLGALSCGFCFIWLGFDILFMEKVRKNN